MVTIDLSNYKTILPYLLNQKLLLDEECDYIIFNLNDENLIYKPRDSYLSNMSHGSNALIFHKLGLNEMTFCKNVYGHEPNNCDFPEPKKNVNTCLINVTYKLFEECEKQYKPIKQLALSNVTTKISLIEPLIKENESCPFASEFEDNPFV